MIASPIQRRTPLTDTAFSAAVPQLLAQIYRNRGITCETQLDLRLQNLLPAQDMKGIDQAVALLTQALQEQWRILIIGDYDADGATGCALAMLALHDMGYRNINYFIPNRFEQGYGFSKPIAQLAHQRRTDLIITVDNGITSIEGIQVAYDLGMRVLISDHHLPSTRLPSNAVIVNPNQPGCSFASKNLAGCAVVFYVVAALHTHLHNWFMQQQITPVSCSHYLDLVAIATIADMMPLDYNNRILVHHGLHRIRSGKTRPGILALLKIAKRQLAYLSADDLAFSVIPMLNAAGRLDDMSVGVECLLSTKEELAHEHALELHTYNTERRKIEHTMHEQAQHILNSMQLNDQRPYGICLYDAQWHQGVIGILAGRIKAIYHRPTIIFAGTENILQGSARSISGFHIQDALVNIDQRHRNLLLSYGGHAMAAGLTIRKENYAQFSAIFNAEVQRQVPLEDLSPTILSDGLLSSDLLSIPIAKALHENGPWGQHFIEPLFDGEFTLHAQHIMAERHLKLQVSSPDAIEKKMDAIVFQMDHNEWPDKSVRTVHIAYQLKMRRFQGMEHIVLIVKWIKKLTMA